MVRSKTEARELIEKFTQASSEPLLTEEEIDALVEQAACGDDTWDINAAVAGGWQIKGRRATPGPASSECSRQYVRWRLRVGEPDIESEAPPTLDDINRRMGRRQKRQKTQ